MALSPQRIQISRNRSGDDETVEISLTVHSIRHLPPLFQRKVESSSGLSLPSKNNARVRVRADLKANTLRGTCSSLISSSGRSHCSDGTENDASMIQCTALSTKRSSREDGEVHWKPSSEGGKMTWTISFGALRKLKHYSPKVKLEIEGVVTTKPPKNSTMYDNHSHGSSDSNVFEEGEVVKEKIGWVSVDLRDLEVNRKDDLITDDVNACRWFKVNGVLGSADCEINVSMKAVSEKETEPNDVIMEPSCDEISILASLCEDDGSGSNKSIGSVARQSDDSGEAFETSPILDSAISCLTSQEPFSIGDGQEIFELEIKLCMARNLHLLGFEDEGKTPSDFQAWLSYNCFGAIVQTEKFSLTHLCPEFCPVADIFRIRSSLPDLASYFFNERNAKLPIHVCMEGVIIGTARVDFRSLLALGDDNRIGLRSVQKTCVVKSGEGPSREHDISSSPESGIPHIEISISLSHNQGLTTNEKNKSAESYTIIPCDAEEEKHRDQNNNRTQISTQAQNSPQILAGSLGNHQEEVNLMENMQKTDSCSSPCTSEKGGKSESSKLKDAVSQNRRHHQDNNGIPQQVEEDINRQKRELKEREEAVALSEKRIEQAENDVGERMAEWKEWRRSEEERWNEKLKEKEEAAMRALEEEIRSREMERVNAAESSRLEYVRLETQLKKALAGLEARERQLQKDETSRQSEYTKKMGELHLQERVMREEVKHSIDLERAKLSAEVEKTSLAEKAAAAASMRAKQIEEDFENFRMKQRQSPEALLLQEIAKLKGMLADSESRIQTSIAEKNQALLEKEQFRASVHKLARALRLERKKTAAYKQKEIEQIRVSYAETEKGYALDGDRAELHRIKDELSTLEKNNQQTPECHPRNETPLRKNNNVHHGTTYIEHSHPRTDLRRGPPPSPMAAPQHPSNYEELPRSPTSVGGRISLSSRKQSPSPTIAQGIPPSRYSVPGSESERLQKEKKDLMSTGLYGTDHPIVVRLDKLLQEANKTQTL